MRAFTSVLKAHLLEARIETLTPGTLRAKHLLQMLTLLRVALSKEIVNQKCVFVLALKLQFRQATNCIKRLLLHSLQNLILGLIVLAHALNALD